MANRRIEYVFGPPRPYSGHSLGVSTMTLSTDISLLANSYGTLFTGGRDGRINAWGLCKPAPSSNSLSATPQATSQYFQGTQAARVTDMHTNWVSDLQLLNNESIVSCSADTTVKIWNVAKNDVATIGHHTDYAQCLAKLHDDTVVSGGLDERILGWNVGRHAGSSSSSPHGCPPPLFDIKTGHSIYAIAAAPPHLIVGGASDGALRIWDTRQTDHYIAKFTGHTDGIRSLFVTQDGDSVVSGSSDGTVRVWSLRTGRIFKTLNQFGSSIWSLTPHENGFLAGDRNGTIYHSPQLDEEPRVVVDHGVQEGGLRGLCSDPMSGNLWVASTFSPDIRCIKPTYNEQTQTTETHEVERLRGHKGLRKHRLMNDKRRALVVDTDGDVGMVDLVSAKQLDFKRHIDLSHGKSLDAKLDEILDEVNTMDVLDNWCQVQIKAGQVCTTLDQRSINNTEVYLDDLIKHVATTDKTPQPSPQPSPHGTPGATPIASPISTPFGSGYFRQGRSPLVSPAVSRVTSSQSLTEIARAEQQQRSRSLMGTGHGRAKFYDLEGEEGGPADGNYDGATATKGGSSGNAEDDQEEPADSETVDDEIRINLGNFVLENLLRGVVAQLKQEYENLPEPPALPTSGVSSQSASSAGSSVQGGKDTGTDGREKKRTKFFSKILGIGKKKEDSTGDSNSVVAGTSAGTSPGTASTGTVTGGNSHTVGTGNSGETQQQLKQKAQKQQQNEPDSANFQEAWSRAVAHRSFHRADPESPEPDTLSRRARVVVTEIAPGAGAPTEVFSTTVGNLIKRKSDVEKIEKVLPGWVGDAVILGKLNLKNATKIGFAVFPQESELPELAQDNTRLMAISMLRARKIMAYTVGQLQQAGILSAKASEVLPEELVTLTCLDTELSPLTTLATIRTRIWRKGGDVAIKYQLKKKI